MQSNKFVRDHNPDSKVFLKKQKRGLKSDLIHLLRTLRDIETIEGKVSPEIQQAYAIFMKQTKDKRRVK